MSYAVGLFDIRIEKIIHFRVTEYNVNQLYLFEKH